MSQKIVWQKLAPADVVEEGDFWVYGGDPNYPPLSGELDDLVIEIIQVGDPYIGTTRQGDAQNYYWRPVALNTEKFIHSTIKQTL